MNFYDDVELMKKVFIEKNITRLAAADMLTSKEEHSLRNEIDSDNRAIMELTLEKLRFRCFYYMAPEMPDDDFFRKNADICEMHSSGTLARDFVDEQLFIQKDRGARAKRQFCRTVARVSAMAEIDGHLRLILEDPFGMIGADVYEPVNRLMLPGYHISAEIGYADGFPPLARGIHILDPTREVPF